ncbi:Protein kinase [Gracilaria domingensis]|nr:Protein kinase [Gracilaria domingensis]
MKFVGEILKNRWVVGPLVGAGRTGLVYQVTDNRNEYPDAVVKVAAVEDPDEGEEDALLEQAEDNLENELHVLKNVDDKAPILRVPRVLDYGMHGDNHFFIMTRVGETVEELHEDAGWEFSNAEIMFISLQVFEIMITLHSLGRIHGDIKEGNVARGLGADKDKFSLIDFGDSKSLQVSSPANDVGAFLDMMVRLFRGGFEGLVPDHDEDDYVWCNLLDEEVRQMKKNFDDAVEARYKQGMPIPDPIKVLVYEAIGPSAPTYDRMTALMREAYAQTVDPNEALFERY